MGTARSDAESHPTPSPAPASDVRLAEGGAIKHALSRTDLEGARLAEEMCGDDEDCEIAALVAGTHPFQRHLSEDALAASKHQAALLPAVLRP